MMLYKKGKLMYIISITFAVSIFKCDFMQILFDIRSPMRRGPRKKPNGIEFTCSS